MAFLQARMGSTRLPGKVLMQIQGKSILERVILRLRAAPAIDGVAVLTTSFGEDDSIAKEARRLGALVYRGPDQDVLRRFQEASEEFKPEVIVRATADNPLIDIGSVNRIVHALRSGDLDLCMEDELPYGAATEACTSEALAKAHLLAREPRHREHVTLYIKEHPEEFRVGFLKAPKCLRQPHVRVTVDTPEDLVFMNRLICSLPERNGPIPLNDYIPIALSAGQAGPKSRMAP
jgi:spore coat polysaccharide biosynthesis protein SpsF